MREIVLDTETTGFEYDKGHRMVEIGCVEIENMLPTGNVYHQYINPERDMPIEAFNVHGLSEEFLSDYPVFKKIGQEFLDFIGDAQLVIHNAAFDLPFLNFELECAGLPKIADERAVDTLLIARKKYPGSPVNLDALCRRYDIDNSERTYHGALLDSELLAEVYLELSGGRQHGLTLSDDQNDSGYIDITTAKGQIKEQMREKRIFKASADEIAAHTEMMEKLKNPIWLKSDETASNS